MIFFTFNKSIHYNKFIVVDFALTFSLNFKICRVSIWSIVLSSRAKKQDRPRVFNTGLQTVGIEN